MALEGELEDLNFRDILQILSLSKKSGILTLKNGRDEGTICFERGQIIRASSTLFPQGLGQLLRHRNLVTASQVDQAVAHQCSLADHRPLGKIFSDLYRLAPETIETVVAEQIEKIVFSFFSWKEGFFSFRLEQLEHFGSALLNPLDFMLERGLSPQRLVIKGEKLLRQDKEEAVSDELIDRELMAMKTRRKQQGIDLLRGMLAELEHPEFGGGIILLILRYASEIMGRAIIFDVRGRQLVGVGQFGLDGLAASADEVVRKMRLNIDGDSLFSRVLSEKVAQRGPLRHSSAEEDLRTLLRVVPDEVFIAPLVSDGHVVALLYGDSYLSGQTSQTINAFEVFLSQAGLALEQALQEQSAL